jgi:hypothetical protein
MSNIRKSFSFRDGVQVDQDIFVVRGSLVGIGTSVPTEDLDVRGVVSVTGLVTTTTLISGVSTIGNLKVGIVSVFPGGIITATSSSGVVTYFGDGGRLLNLPTSQWLDVDVGLGFTSIYAQGSVGVATNDPRFSFQVGSNPDNGGMGVGINSTGNIRASGILTAKSFVGFGSGITEINASNISTGTLNNSRLPIIANDRFAPNISLSGIITANSAYFGTIVATGNITGIAETARGLVGQPSIDVWRLLVQKNAQINGITTTNTLVSTGASIGVATVTSSFNIGVGGTIFAALESGRIGLGTNLPTSDFQIKKQSNVTLEVISESGQSRVSIGQSVGIGNSSTVLRFGSIPRSFEIINNDYGNVDFRLHNGNGVGLNTGGFNWIYGQTNETIASLTYDGKLGIGKTNPQNELEVVGTSTITSNLFVGGDLSIVGGFEAGTGINRVSFGGGEENLLNNTNIIATNGISTVSQLNVIGVGSIGIQTASPITGFDARPVTGLFAAVGVKTDDAVVDLHVIGKALISEGIGIGTTSFDQSLIDEGAIQVYNQGISVHNSAVVVKGIGALGVNTSFPAACLDLSQAISPEGTKSVALMPSVNNTELTAMGFYQQGGGLVYNREIKTFQYTRGDGSPWINLTGPWVVDDEETNNGIYHINQNSNSSVGIGTSIPNSALHVIGDIQSSSSIFAKSIVIEEQILGKEITTDNLLLKDSTVLGITTYVGSQSSLYLISGASIGIGTTSARASLDVNGDTLIQGNLFNIDGGYYSSGIVSTTDIVVAKNGFTSQVGGDPVEISVVGSDLVLNVVGIGSVTVALT